MGAGDAFLRIQNLFICDFLHPGKVRNWSNTRLESSANPKTPNYLLDKHTSVVT